MNNTKEAAEIMYRNGGWFTAAELGKHLGVSAVTASGFIYNIRNSNKYQIQETPLPGRKIKVLSIKGSEHLNQSLWRVALFGGKAA
jgi:hypothetical protein